VAESSRPDSKPPARQTSDSWRTTVNRAQGTGVSTLATNVNTDVKGKEASPTCKICNEAHTIENCETFKRMDVDKCAQTAKEKKLCFCCLNSCEHTAKLCSLKKQCGVSDCERRHHPLIHGAKPVDVGATGVECCSSNVLLQIVPLVVQTPS